MLDNRHIHARQFKSIWPYINVFFITTDNLTLSVNTVKAHKISDSLRLVKNSSKNHFENIRFTLSDAARLISSVKSKYVLMTVLIVSPKRAATVCTSTPLAIRFVAYE